MTLLRIVSNEVMPYQMSIIDRINRHAQEMGLVKKEGAFYNRDGSYFGTIYSVGRLAAVEMYEWK